MILFLKKLKKKYKINVKISRLECCCAKNVGIDNNARGTRGNSAIPRNIDKSIWFFSFERKTNIRFTVERVLFIQANGTHTQKNKHTIVYLFKIEVNVTGIKQLRNRAATTKTRSQWQWLVAKLCANSQKSESHANKSTWPKVIIAWKKKR